MRKVKLLLYVVLLLVLEITIVSNLFSFSIEKVIEKRGWNTPFLTIELENDSALLFIEEEKGEIRLASAYQGLFGWKIAEDKGILSVSNDERGFSGKEANISLHKSKKIHYLLGIISDEDIDDLAIHSSEGQSFVNTFTTQQGTRIYYATDEQDFGEVTYMAYNHQDELLYSKP